jgi:ParB family transcriptional regulator, chromosome partitioning protein
VARRSGLGRGLGALLPTEVVSDRTSDLAEIPVSAIDPNPGQPRTHFDEELLASLAASIRELGVLQPVLVRPADGGRYQLIAGERRWRAAKRVGLQTIPALIRTVADEHSLEQALVENLHRQDLNPLEEAAAYQQLVEGFGLTHDEVAARVGKSRAAVSNTLRLFQLPPAIQRMVMDGALSAGHARALLGTPDRAFQESLARRAVGDQLSVRAVEDAVRDRNELAGAAGPVARAGAGSPSPRPRPAADAERGPAVYALEEMLSEFLETRVRIELGAKKSRLSVEFADLDDLERIYRRMLSS